MQGYLDEIVVTASRLPQPLASSILHSTLLGEEEIEASLAPDLPTLLRQQAGIEITQTGGIGTQSSLFLRGANSNQTLILLDGMRIDSATTGATAIDQIMLADIERIEIVRGNVSALYGSSAIGGVIQIFTKKGQGAPGGVVKLGLGSYGTRSAQASYGGSMGSTRFHLGLSRRASDGFSAARSEYIPTPWVFAPADTDRDGYRNTTLTANFAHTLQPGHDLSALVRLSRGRVEYDGTWSNRSEQDLDAWQVASDNEIGARWHSRLMLGASRDRLDNFLDAAPTGFVRTLNRQVEWLNTLTPVPGHDITASVGILSQRVASNMTYTRTQRQVRHLALGYAGGHGRHAWQANVRHDDYSDFGAHDTGLAGYGYALTPGLRLLASLSTAFRAPTFNDLYNPLWGGNPNLRPEKAKSWEVGLHYSRPGLDARLVHFDSRTRDLIVFVWPTGLVNLDRARSDGWEASLTSRLGGFDLRLSLTLQDPRNAQTGVSLPRRAKRLGSLSLARSQGPWSWQAELKASGDREDIHVATFSPVRNPGYAVVNLAARYQFRPDLSLNARLDNLFDRDYSLVHGYNTPGRSAYVSLDWQF
ncbi:MAG: TonB-dependent receptor domain-containing protein [Thiobacillaceae bacterium]